MTKELEHREKISKEEITRQKLYYNDYKNIISDLYEFLATAGLIKMEGEFPHAVKKAKVRLCLEEQIYGFHSTKKLLKKYVMHIFMFGNLDKYLKINAYKMYASKKKAPIDKRDFGLTRRTHDDSRAILQ